MAILHMAAALWWGLAITVLTASFLAALLHPRLSGKTPPGDVMRPVSVLVPVYEWNDQFEDDQASLFAQAYPGLEVLVTSADDNSPALDAVRRVQARFPQIPCRILKSHVDLAASPKLNNLWDAVAAARHDLILTKDSNVRLAPGDLERLVRHHGPGVGLVSTISITRGPQSLGAWIECSIINNYHARMLMLAAALGLGVGCGKVMLFSRADLERAGGLERLAWAVGEDEAMHRAFQSIGLRTILSDRTSGQVLGTRTPTDVWQRQLRWMLIWRLQTPVVLIGEFLFSALPVSLAALLAAPLAGLAPLVAMAGTLALWFVLETILSLAKGWPWSPWSLPAFLGREILVMALRLQCLATREVWWGGAQRTVARRVHPS